ncbi:MAG: BLUF domain-containing protein [Alkalilacustris sp.]
MVAIDALPNPGRHRLLRIVYASRDRHAMSPAAVGALVRQAARENLRRRISGVLLHGRGRFVQWLEGPGGAVCDLMARIVADPRHDQVRLVGVGWTDGRRFARWPMQLAQDWPDIGPQDGMAELDALAALHREPPEGTPGGSGIAVFADGLLRPGGDGPAGFPAHTGPSLRARADVVEATCAELARTWREDRCRGAEVTLALARLGGLWHRAGRSPEPLRPHGEAAVVVPPGAGEMMGAMVKTDLMRAAGVSVRVVLEPTEAGAFAALANGPEPVIVAAPRVDHTGDGDRAAAFCDRVRDRFPGRCVLVGGAGSGPLVDLPARLQLRFDDTSGIPAASVAWAALAEVARLAKCS